MPGPSSHTLPLVVLATASCVWGLAWLPLKTVGTQGLGGIALVFVACCVAGALLLPRLLAEHAAWRHDLRGLALIALLGGYSNLSFAVATIYGDIVRVMVLFYLLPAWSALGGRLFLGERLDAARLLGLALALVGAFLTLGGARALEGDFAWTDVLAVTCGMAFAGNNLLFRAKQSIPLGSKTAAMVIGGALIAAVLLAGGVQPWPTVPPAAWLGAAGYGLAWLFVANLATKYGVTHLEAGRASIIILLELVVAVASAVVIGGEQMSGQELAGGTLILTAAFLEARRAR
jgi:drug/metabolite transporter (DMT)-like permease